MDNRRYFTQFGFIALGIFCLAILGFLTDIYPPIAVTIIAMLGAAFVTFDLARLVDRGDPRTMMLLGSLAFVGLIAFTAAAATTEAEALGMGALVFLGAGLVWLGSGKFALPTSN